MAYGLGFCGLGLRALQGFRAFWELGDCEDFRVEVQDYDRTMCPPHCSKGPLCSAGSLVGVDYIIGFCFIHQQPYIHDSESS